MKVRSKAPLRLGFAGGGTDISPYSDHFVGNVLNATIGLYTYCTIEGLDNNEIVFNSLDMGISWSGRVDESVPIKDELILHKAVYNRVINDFNNGSPLSLKVVTNSDVPVGSGLGTSSTMVVAMLIAYREYLSLPLGEYDIAHLAYEIERVDCALTGGKQDQYAATFGGFNFIEFYPGDKVVVNPLRIKPEIINELELNLLLLYTGRSRESAKIISEQIGAMNNSLGAELEAMHKVKSSAVRMKECLLKSEIPKMSEILSDAWEAKKATAASVTNSYLESIFQVALKNGATSAKLSGAGGGGFMLLFVDPEKREQVKKAVLDKSVEAKFFNLRFENIGGQSWQVR